MTGTLRDSDGTDCGAWDYCPDEPSECEPTPPSVTTDDMLAVLKNLVARDLIKDTDGDHYDEVLAAIANADVLQT